MMVRYMVDRLDYRMLVTYEMSLKIMYFPASSFELHDILSEIREGRKKAPRKI